MSLDYVVRRQNGTYSFRISVPKGQKEKIGRREFWVSLKTKDRKEAIIKSAALLDQYTRLFNSDFVSDDTPLTMPIMHKTCERLGIQSLTPETIEAASIQDYVAMMSQNLYVLNKITKPDIAQVAAIGGAIDTSAMNMLEVYERYVELTPGKFLDLDERAKAQKLARYRRSAQDFVEAMGNIDVVKMSSKDANEFAAKMVARVAKEEIDLTTAKARFRFVKMFVQKVFKSDYPNSKNPFEQTDIESNTAAVTGKRRQFTEAEIVALNAKLEESNANDELKAILAISECTGAIMKEICLMTPADFHLEGEYPFITIGPNANRKFVKTGKSRHRDLPLIGKALDAARRYATTGFKRYCRSAGSEALSASANKLIASVAPGATTYSYRHRFAYLLQNASVGDSMKNALMGHHSPGVTGHYGDGYDMPNKHEAVKKALALAEKKQKELQTKP